MPVLIRYPSIQINSLRFSAGEMHVHLEKLPEEKPEKIILRADIHSSDDLMVLLLTHSALQNHYGEDLVIHLEMPYFPYARQDRVCAVGQAFSLSVIAKIISDLKVNVLTIWDAHSPVATALTKARNITQEEIIASNKKLVSHLRDENTVLVCPDKGAREKSQAVREKFSVNEMINAEKVRNPATGKIIDTRLEAGDLSGKKAIIIDDICDGGRTFIEIAKKLKERNIERVILYISHGIFSKGLDVFEGLIDEIYTSNSFPQMENPKLTVIDDADFVMEKGVIKNEL